MLHWSRRNKTRKTKRRRVKKIIRKRRTLWTRRRRNKRKIRKRRVIKSYGKYND